MPPASGTVRELVEHYRAEILPDHRSGKHTGRLLDGMLRTAAFVERPALSLTEEDFEKWFKARLRMRKRGGELVKPSTVLFELGTWRRVFNAGRLNGWCGLTRRSPNPCTELNLPKQNLEGRPVKMVTRERMLEGTNGRVS